MQDPDFLFEHTFPNCCIRSLSMTVYHSDDGCLLVNALSETTASEDYHLSAISNKTFNILCLKKMQNFTKT